MSALPSPQAIKMIFFAFAGREYNDRRGFDTVRKMIREHLLSSTYLKDATDQDKQTVAETFAYQAMIAMNTYQTLVVAEKHSELEEFTSIDHSLKKSGFRLERVKIDCYRFYQKKFLDFLNITQHT